MSWIGRSMCLMKPNAGWEKDVSSLLQDARSSTMASFISSAISGTLRDQSIHTLSSSQKPLCKTDSSGINPVCFSACTHCRHLFFCPNAGQSIIYFYKFGIMRNLWNYENSIPNCTSARNEGFSNSEKYLSGKNIWRKSVCLNCEIVPFRSVLFPYYAKSRLIFSLFLVRNMNRSQSARKYETQTATKS